jgi:hypothetical protein
LRVWSGCPTIMAHTLQSGRTKPTGSVALLARLVVSQLRWSRPSAGGALRTELLQFTKMWKCSKLTIVCLGSKSTVINSEVYPLGRALPPKNLTFHFSHQYLQTQSVEQDFFTRIVSSLNEE